MKRDIVTAVIYCYITTEFHYAKTWLWLPFSIKAYLITFFAWHGSSVTCNRIILFTSKEKKTLIFQTNIDLRFLTSAKVLTIFPGKFHHCFWQSKHDVIYHRQHIAWQSNTFFSALNILFESEQKQKFQITKSSVSLAKRKYSLTLENLSLSSQQLVPN